MKLFVLGRTAQRTLATTSAQKYHSIPINFGLGDWWGYAGKTKAKTEIAAFDPSKRVDCQFRDPYTVYPQDVAAPPGVAAGTFNVIDGDAPGQTPLGSAVQFESVGNTKEIPSWYVNFNAWKFRQDHPSGNASRLGQLNDDQVNCQDSMLDAMRERMYDAQRQDHYYRIERADYVGTRKDTLPYEDWSPISADHKYLNATGRQLFAEMDEEFMMDKITTGTSKVTGKMFAPWTGLRTIRTMAAVKAKVNASVLRSQF